MLLEDSINMRSEVMHAEYKAMARCKKSLRLWNNAAVRLHSAALGAVDCRQVDERPTCAADITCGTRRYSAFASSSQRDWASTHHLVTLPPRADHANIMLRGQQAGHLRLTMGLIASVFPAIGACAAVVGEHQLEHREMYAVILEMVAWVFFLLGESL